MRGCCAIAAAEASRTPGASHGLLKEAVKAARRLGRVNLPYAAPLANLLKAGVAAQRGVTAETASRLQAAILELDVQQMPVYAAAARRRLARLRGENVADFLPGQEIADADAVTRMLLPGFNGR